MSVYSRFRVMSVAVASMATAAAFSVPAVAQAQDGTAGALLEEIVTVARKRSQAESVQDVPLAVTAYGADQLDALFVKQIEDLSYVMPNVQLESVGTFPGVQNFSIRGQGINSSIPSVDPTVGVFVDGIFMGTTYGVVIDTFDLESVEVLRGPQGLLFGRNVTGGAVVLRNARPTGEFGARVRVGTTDEDDTNVAAAIEGSLSEGVLAAKLVVYYDDDAGYYKNSNPTAAANPVHPLVPLIDPAPHFLQPFYVNPADGSNVGAMETTFIRPTLVWTPSESVEFVFSHETGEMDGDGAAWTSVTAQEAGILPDFSTVSDEVGFTSIDWDQTVVEVNIDDVGNGTITNILGMREVQADSAADIDGTDLPIFAAPGFTNQEQFSNELRWAGSFTDNWDVTLGAYIFDQDIVYREARYIWLPPPIGPAPFGLNTQAALGGDMDAKNTGYFWNNDFRIGDALTLTAGLRYTEEEKTARIIIGGCTDNANFNCQFDNLSGKWDNVTPKVGAQFRFSDTTQVYGYWSKGYRSGGFNFRNARPNIIPPGPTREEENNTVEIGLKTDFADNRIRLNVAAFHNEIEDMQREINVPDPQVIVFQATLNAGDVTIQGVEVDLVAAVTDNFVINASYGWQDGEYDRFDPGAAAIEALLRQVGALGPNTPLFGADLPRLAPTNYTVGFSWDIPVGTSLINVAASHSFREGHPYDDANSQLFSDQERTNASVSWFSANDRWNVSLFGRNLQDEANWGNLTSIAGLWTAGPMKKGRELGLEVNFRYE